VVVHDEPGVDGDRRRTVGHVVGVRVPAEARLGLEERHVARVTQDVGGGEPGHSGADDGH
jgi:hypothetical protein